MASATVEALDEERLSEIVAALDGPSAAVLPAGIVSDLERDRIVDAAAGCLPWTQTILDSLQDLPDVPPAVVECAQAAAPSVETDRLDADIVRRIPRCVLPERRSAPYQPTNSTATSRIPATVAVSIDNRTWRSRWEVRGLA